MSNNFVQNKIHLFFKINIYIPVSNIKKKIINNGKVIRQFLITINYIMNDKR